MGRNEKITLERVRIDQVFTQGNEISQKKLKDKNSKNFPCGKGDKSQALSESGGYASKELGILKEKQIQIATGTIRWSPTPPIGLEM